MPPEAELLPFDTEPVSALAFPLLALCLAAVVGHLQDNMSHLSLCSRMKSVLRLALLRRPYTLRLRSRREGWRVRLMAARAACCGSPRRGTGTKRMGVGGGVWGSGGGLVSAGTGEGRAVPS